MNKFDCCEFNLKIKYQIPIEINGKKLYGMLMKTLIIQ